MFYRNHIFISNIVRRGRERVNWLLSEGVQFCLDYIEIYFLR